MAVLSLVAMQWLARAKRRTGAIGIAVLAVREGREAWSGDRCCVTEPPHDRR